ncbi:phosphoglycerate dehydrogenase [Lacipirellula limnantheis]|uniref:D-3-phosphoglycerate dehydrogenase n=1 Tax=Lacipirellula limnantheis TaxID=2528024 RepID=A0A517U2W3_9BACT|nr:phosphoglycerate dehydrogenase [Lacipirellula limnantheis]QDT74964.1 D-3-phosphoglycerate dehydrogenase [Lacipirellula limnantheis]
MPSVIVLDTLSQEGLDLLDAAPGITYEVRTGLKGDDLRKALAEFDGAICRSGVKITPEALEGNRKLKAIVRAGVGTDNINSAAATRAGVVVMNTPAGNTLSTAEHAVTLMLALSRNVAPAYQGLIEGRWDRAKYMGAQVAGKTLGVVGLGRIGLAVAKRAQAFEMRVLGYDPFMSKEKAKELGIEWYEKVDDMLPHVDYLSVHTPLTEETRNLIDIPQLERLKPGVRLINAARGGIYNEAALVEGLKSGKIGGVALDVFVEEPCTNSPLFGMPGVLCTPHLGASTEEAQTQVAVEAVQLLTDFLSTGQIKNAVNIASLDAKMLEQLRGYLDVAFRLGRLAAGLIPSGLKSCKLTYRGEIAARDTKVLTAAFSAGLLQGALEEEVNLVNASLLLEERGIKLSSEARTDMGAFRSAMSFEIEGADGQKHKATGTVFGQSMPRLVSLDGYRLEAYLDGCLLVFTHKDVPGIIGGVGTAFGEHNVNIGQMAVGRAGEAPGGEAVGILNLDCEPPAAAVEAVRKLPAISSAKVIHLPSAGQLPTWLQG